MWLFAYSYIASSYTGYTHTLRGAAPIATIGFNVPREDDLVTRSTHCLVVKLFYPMSSRSTPPIKSSYATIAVQISSLHIHRADLLNMKIRPQWRGPATLAIRAATFHTGASTGCLNDTCTYSCIHIHWVYCQTMI